MTRVDEYWCTKKNNKKIKLKIKTTYWNDKTNDEWRNKTHTLLMYSTFFTSCNFLLAGYYNNTLFMIINGLIILQLIIMFFSFQKWSKKNESNTNTKKNTNNRQM